MRSTSATTGLSQSLPVEIEEQREALANNPRHRASVNWAYVKCADQAAVMEMNEQALPTGIEAGEENNT